VFVRRHAHGRQAGVVHGRDRGTDDDAAEHRAVADDDGKTQSGADDSDRRGKHGKTRLVADGKSRHERQQRDELHCPDAAAGHRRRRDQPGIARHLAGLAGAGDERERGVVRQETDQARQSDEPGIMLVCYGDKRGEHRESMPGHALRSIETHVFREIVRSVVYGW